MHPPLHRPHPSCHDVIQALEKCHQENVYKKFIGVCNNAKADLDACFRVRDLHHSEITTS